LPKSRPEERWQHHVLELCQAFLASPEFRVLRREGLRSLGRRKLLTPQEWNESFSLRSQNEDFLTFVERCRMVGEGFGLAAWTVEMACLVQGYQPEPGAIQVEAKSASIRVITDTTNDLFLRWLLYEAHRLDIHVNIRKGNTELPVITVPFPAMPDQPLTKQLRPAPDRAFYIRVETPPLYPPEAAAELHRQAQQAARELLRRLGYRVRQRLRTTKAVAEAKKLRIAKKSLGHREAGDIAEDIYGEGAGTNSKLRRRVKDIRNKLRKRLKDYLDD